MSQGLPSSLATASLLLGLLGCGEQGRAINYELTIVPVLPPSQAALFDDLATLLVRVADDEGTIAEYELPLTPGANTAIEDLAALPEGCWIEIEGFAGDGVDGPVAARGRSGRLDWGIQEIGSVEVFVAATDEMATFDELSSRSFGAAVASDGQGNFWIFGGTDSSPTSTAVDTVQQLSLLPVDPSFQPSIETTLPTTSNDYGNDITGRLGHTATPLLDGDHNDVGKILITGGWSSYQKSRSVTTQALLFDPATQSYEEIAGGMKSGRSMHQAVPLSSGEVVFFGGYSWLDSLQSIDGVITAEVYHPTTREFDYGSQTLPHDLIDGASAALDDRAIYCGGMDLENNGDWAAYGDCVTVDRFGNTDDISGPPGLQGAGLMLPAMASLDNNRVLLSGGAEANGVVDASTWTEGSNRAFVYSGETSSWQEVASMKVPRVGHAAVSLPDGRVLVAGGAAQMRSAGVDLQEAIACAEVYDPDENTWTLLDASCGLGSQVGSLPTGMYRPSIARDPYHGALIWGGLEELQGNPSSIPWYALYVPRPE